MLTYFHYIFSLVMWRTSFISVLLLGYSVTVGELVQF